MIGEALRQVAIKLETAINQLDIDPNSNISVEVGNIASLEGNTSFESDILMSLVNIEQDTPLRNNAAYTKISDTEIKRHNPQIILNLYVLFSVPEAQNRVTELDYLTYVIAALQKQNVFKPSDFNSPNIFNTGYLTTEKIIFDQYSMTFEQLNHLWGVLGGKYLPSVLYKVRLVSVFVDTEERGSVVESIERRESVIN